MFSFFIRQMLFEQLLICLTFKWWGLEWKHSYTTNCVSTHSSPWINRSSNPLSLKCCFAALRYGTSPKTHTTSHIAHFLIVKALALIICSRNFSIRSSFLDFCLMLNTLLPFWLLFRVLVLPEEKKTKGGKEKTKKIIQNQSLNRKTRK